MGKKTGNFISKVGKVFLFLVLITFYLGSFYSCKKDKKETAVDQKESISKKAEAVEASEKWQKMLALDLDTLKGDFQKEGVKVVSLHPQGLLRNLSEVDEINITFSRPIAPLQQISTKTESLIETFPALKGEGYFKSSTTYCFVIKDKLSESANYRVIFKGYESPFGIKVDKKEWNFTTPLITLLKTKPYHKQKRRTPNQKVLIKFSQSVNPIDIKPFIKIQVNNNNWENFIVRYSTEEERKALYYWQGYRKEPKKFITISATLPYPVAAGINIRFLKGITSIGGNTGMALERVLKFGIYEKFKINKVSKEFNPDKGIKIELSNQVKIIDFLKSIKIEPAVKININYYYRNDNFRIIADFKPNTRYTLFIPAGIKDIFDNRLAQDETFTAFSKNYSPYLLPPSNAHFVLENYLEKVIPVQVRNITSTKVYYKKLSPEELTKIADKSRLDIKSIKLEECESYLWEMPTKVNQYHVLAFKLKDIGIKEPGVYFIKFARATNYRGKKGAIFQLTDSAIIAKYSPTQIFLTSFNLKSGELIQNLKYNISGGDYKGRIKSKGDGVAILKPKDSIFLKEDLLNFKIFSLSNGSFIWGKKSPMFNMWNFEYDYNINYRYSPQTYYHRLFMFTDKYLYKAGQMVKFKGVFRDLISGELKIPKIEKIEGTVFDSLNKKIKTLKIDLNNFKEYGSFAHQFELPRKSPSGFYRIDLKVTKPGEKDPYRQSLDFSVQEYKPAKFEVKTKFDQKDSIAGEKISGNVNGRYLFGTPMKNSQGNFNLRIRNIYFTPRGWSKFSFGTSESGTDRTIDKKDIKLNKDGDFYFSRDNFTFDTKNSVRVNLYGEIKDKDNNRISSSSSMVVHRGSYYIGVKTSSYFFTAKKPGKIQIITVEPKGKKTADTQLDMLVEKVSWKSYRKKDASGSLRWYWERERNKIFKKEVTVEGGETEVNYTFEDPGYYEITLTGQDKYQNVITTTGNLYVIGSGYVPWKMNEGRIIDLVTDKKKYKEGDTVKLLIKSPFKKSTVLITAEREKVFWYQTVKLEGNANTIDITVKKEFLPNIFFSVLLLKERTGLDWDEDGNDIGKPEFYSGYTEVKVDSNSKKLSLNITADRPVYHPGEPVELDILVTNQQGDPVQSEVCISVVDKGVLNLVGYELPDPFQYFYQERPLDIRTVSTLTDVLGRRKFAEKSENPGGGVGASLFGSVVVRKNFKESVFYSAFLKTDREGKAKVSFYLPDNLTTFKAMAVTVDNDQRFGKGKTELLVKKELILKPALPDFLRPEDKFEGGVTVTNNTDQQMKVSIKAEFEEVNLLDDTDVKEVLLDSFETKPVLFFFEALVSKKSPKFTFKAIGNTYSDGYEQSIFIRMPKFPETVATSGEVLKKKADELIIIPKNSIREFDEFFITLSPSISAGAQKSYCFLKEYPYDCLEQRISRTYPLVKDINFLSKMGIIQMDVKERQKKVYKLIKVIGDFQNSDGGFGYYPDSMYSGWYLSVFTTEFILDAKKEGFEIDEEILKKAQEYLKKICRNSIDSQYPYPYDLKLLNSAYASYVLAKDKVFLKDTINNLFEIRERVPLEGISYLIRTLDLDRSFPEAMQAVLTKILLNNMKDAPTKVHFENHESRYWWTVHGSSLRTTALIFDTLLGVYQRFPFAPKIARWLYDNLREKQYLITQQHLYIIKAFDRYFNLYEIEDPKFLAQVFLKNKEIINKEVHKRSFLLKQGFSLKDYSPGEKVQVKIKKEGKGILYYLAKLKYFPKGKLEKINRGFDISKKFYNLTGKEIKNALFKAGEKYIVELSITTNQERSFVIVNDSLPAGFKVLNPNFKTVSEITREMSNSQHRYYRYWGSFYRSQYYFDRIELFADFLTRGTHTWKYMVVATNNGDYDLPASMVLEMYNPEVFGRNENQKIKIK